MPEGSPAAQVLAAVATHRIDGASVPERICESCAEAMPVDGVALSLIADGAHRALVCASNDEARRIEELETTVGEGPGTEAFRTSGPVLIADVGRIASGRWPAFLDGVDGSSIRAIFAFPLQLGAARLGTMTLYRNEPGSLPEDAFSDALRVADVVALLMLGRDGGLTHDFDAQWMDRSTWTREVDQATGMLTVQLDVGAEEAFVRLRAYAFSHSRPLSEVAHDVVGRRLRLHDES